MDLAKDVPQAEINAEVDRMKLSRLNTAVVKFTFKHMLLKCAYARADFRRMCRRDPPLAVATSSPNRSA